MYFKTALIQIFFIPIFWLICPLTLSGQHAKIPYPPRFTYNQLDSLSNDECSKILKDSSSALVAIYSYWDMGGIVRINSEVYPNGFGIYVLYLNKNKFFVRKIDNFGYYEKIQVNGQEVKDMIDVHYEEMNFEISHFYMDTVSKMKGSDGKINYKIETHYIASPDDSPKEYFIIYKGNVSRKIENPMDYCVDKKSYVNTYQYKLVLLLQKIRKKVDDKRKWESATKYDTIGG